MLAALAAGAALAASRLATYEVADHSMEPALCPGDWVLAVKTRRARPGGIVVFEHPARPGFDLVKRVASPGEGPGRDDAGFWALGDNPAAGSVDSRSLGPIPVDKLRARVLLRYRPLPLKWLG